MKRRRWSQCSVMFLVISGQPLTTVWTTAQPCFTSGSKEFNTCTTRWSGGPWSNQGEPLQPNKKCLCLLSTTLTLFNHRFNSSEPDVLWSSAPKMFSFSLLPSSSSYADEQGPKHWPDSRFTHVMKLKQAALRAARRLWTDYILVRQYEIMRHDEWKYPIVQRNHPPSSPLCHLFLLCPSVCGQWQLADKPPGAIWHDSTESDYCGTHVGIKKPLFQLLVWRDPSGKSCQRPAQNIVNYLKPAGKWLLWVLL